MNSVLNTRCERLRPIQVGGFIDTKIRIWGKDLNQRLGFTKLLQIREQSHDAEIDSPGGDHFNSRG